MLKQLKDSMDFDCGGTVFIEKTVSKDAFINEKIVKLSNDIVYYEKCYKEDLKRNNEANEYLKGLYEEIDRFEPIEKG